MGGGIAYAAGATCDEDGFHVDAQKIQCRYNSTLMQALRGGLKQGRTMKSWFNPSATQNRARAWRFAKSLRDAQVHP